MVTILVMPLISSNRFLDMAGAACNRGKRADCMAKPPAWDVAKSVAVPWVEAIRDELQA